MISGQTATRAIYSIVCLMAFVAIGLAYLCSRPSWVVYAQGADITVEGISEGDVWWTALVHPGRDFGIGLAVLTTGAVSKLSASLGPGSTISVGGAVLTTGATDKLVSGLVDPDATPTVIATPTPAATPTLSPTPERSTSTSTPVSPVATETGLPIDPESIQRLPVSDDLSGPENVEIRVESGIATVTWEMPTDLEALETVAFYIFCDSEATADPISRIAPSAETNRLLQFSVNEHNLESLACETSFVSGIHIGDTNFNVQIIDSVRTEFTSVTLASNQGFWGQFALMAGTIASMITIILAVIAVIKIRPIRERILETVPKVRTRIRAAKWFESRPS